MHFLFNHYPPSAEQTGADAHPCVSKGAKLARFVHVWCSAHAWIPGRHNAAWLVCALQPCYAILVLHKWHTHGALELWSWCLLQHTG